MLTEFYRTYEEAFKWTCSTLVLLVISWILAISTISIFAFTFEKFMLVKGTNIINDPINKKRLKLIGDFCIIFYLFKNTIEVLSNTC